MLYLSIWCEYVDTEAAEMVSVTIPTVFKHLSWLFSYTVPPNIQKQLVDEVTRQKKFFYCSSILTKIWILFFNHFPKGEEQQS